MGEYTVAYHNTSEQRFDLNCSQVVRDSNDLQTLKDGCHAQDPFDKDERHLKSLSSDLIGNGAINCDEAEEIGQKIQEIWIVVKMEESSMQRKDEVIS